MEKKGFTLIELAVSIVLVSIVLIALIGSLLQIRDTYNVIHENSDVIVYTSSISRVINRDINDNNGIKYVSCEPEGKKCSIILGNDDRREIIITDNDKVINDLSDNNITHSNNKTTLKYLDTTKYDKTNNEDDKSLIYIRTLELDKYENDERNVTTTNGYNFYDMSAAQYEYFDNSGSNVEAFTTIVIRLLDGINMDVSDYDITLYGAGRYDYSNYIGRVYTIDLDNSDADTAGTTRIDEVFGVGFFKAESNHRKEDELKKITIPTKEGKAFLGYYYQPYGITVETKIIDSGGNIIASSRLFKNDVKLNEPETGKVYAKWGDCEDGFHVVNGNCVQQEFTVTLNKDTSGKTCDSRGTNSYQVKYQNMVSDVEIPGCAGYTFEGYFSVTNKQYHNRNGEGIEYYDITGNSTFKANWHACVVGEFSLMTQQTCTSCAKGSISTSQGSGSCTACSNGKTTSGVKSTSCNADCSNKNDHVLSWKTPTWNNNNTITNLCTINECKTGYDGEVSSNKCTVNNYKILYTLNSGTYGSSHPTTANYDQTITISNPTRAGYSFKGWTLTNGNPNTAYHGSTAWTNLSTPTKDTTFKNLTATDEATVTMVANWEECPKGSYNPGGSTTCTPCVIGSTTESTKSTSCSACQASGAAGAGGTTSAAGATSCNTSCNKAHVSTWEVASWNTNNTLTNNCKIKTCATGYTLGSNTCTANTYTISYVGMDGASYGASHPTTATYDTAFTVNNPSKTGNTFNGWNITGMDSVTHTYGSNTTTNTSISGTKETSFKNLRSTSGIVTFTAGWTPNQYTLTIKPNGGKYNNSASDTVIKQNYGTTYTVANVSELAKYTITYNMNGTGITAPTSPTSVNRAFTSWAFSGSGTFSGGVFTFGAGAATLTAGYNTTSNSFTLPGLSKEGNSCNWKEESTTGTDRSPGASLTINKNITYYAACKANDYQIIYKDEDGTTTLSGGTPTIYTYGVGATTNWVPTKANKTFNGWSENTSLTGASFTKTISTTATGAKTFYAKWCQNCSPGSNATCNLNANTAGSCTYTTSCPAGYTISNNGKYNPTCTANTFTVAYNANGGSGTTSSHTCTYNANCTLANNSFTRSGYTFNGWKKENSGTALAAGASIKNAATSGTVTYYAQWCQNCSAGTNASCTLTSTPPGTCTYTTSCPTGYNISNNGEYNPTCTPKTFNLVIAANANVTAFSIKEGSTSGTSTSCTKSGNNFTCSNVKYGTKYYLYPTISSGYIFGSYEKTDSSSGSSLGSTSQVNTYYQVGNGNGNIKINVNQLTMQIATIDDCGTTIVDARDGKQYNTALIGSTCWMITNLDIAGGTVITPALSNVATNYTLPASSNANTYYLGDDNDERLFNSGGSHKSYYSYTVAVAGTFNSLIAPFTGDGASTIAQYDICPKGWKLPTVANFIDLRSYYPEVGTGYDNILTTGTPFYADMNGQPLFEGSQRIGEWGYLWASNLHDAGRYFDQNVGWIDTSLGASSVYMRTNVFTTQTVSPGRAYGIRCIMK